MLLTDVQVLAAAYAMGLAAAAPIGPVNMVAIRRGVIGRWTHTLACGIGSALGDLTLLSVVLAGGHWLLQSLQSPIVQRILTAAGVLVLVPLGIYFLVRAVRNPIRSFVRARKRLQYDPPQHLLADVATGWGLTVINPASLVYWVGMTSTWLPAARPVLGWMVIWWGLLMAAAGVMTWFGVLTLLVRFTPHRIGPAFFRVVDAVCGLILLAFGVFCAALFIRQG